MLGPLLFILYTGEMFELVENRLYYTNACDSTLLLVVRKPADRPAVAASRNRDLARIQECRNDWSMIVNPNKTNALEVSGSRTVNPPHGDLILSGVSICASPSLDILGVKFNCKLTFEEHVLGIVCYCAFVFQIHEYRSPVWGSPAECNLQRLERQVYSVATLYFWQSSTQVCGSGMLLLFKILPFFKCSEYQEKVCYFY